MKDERATRCEAKEANNEVLFINNNMGSQPGRGAGVYLGHTVYVYLYLFIIIDRFTLAL